MDLSEEIFALLGICSKTLRIFPGLLAEGTKEQISDAIAQLLVKHGVNPGLAKSVSSRHVSYWATAPEHLNELDDLSDLFTLLRQHGILIGICTSDSRAGTTKSLIALDVLHLVDVIVCGDDPDGRPKPDPHNARMICDQLDIKPEEAVMVGDTPTDIQFAKNGNFGLGVGVLTGIGQREDLERAWYGSERPGIVEKANPDDKFHIVPSVADIIPLVLPDSTIPIQSLLRHTLTESTSSPGVSEMIRLIILDKDGSLTNVHPRWSDWAESICSK
ncbi:unnamed protein product [Echinostoma caproni]|uniref:Phosphoglycolate phosphatase n=1 Tax=Echinostoma caproni TaxID=27848 RepID=A0A183AGY9_9TREM|nr:unnamed protein product [Echinostoma caproni]